MNRKIKILLLMLFSFCTTAAFAQIGISIHDTTFTDGKSIYIPVHADSLLTGLNVTSYKLQLAFNQNLMVIDSAISTGSISQSWGNPTFNVNNPGRIDIAAAGTTALSGNGILLYLKVTAISSGALYLSFTDTLNNYFNEGKPKMIFRNGYFNVQSLPTISVYPTSGLLTVSETLQLSAYNGKAPYSWSVTNPSAAKIDSNGLLTAKAMGFTKVVARDSNGITDTTSFVEVRPFKLSFRDTSYYQGQTVEIPVFTTDLTGLNVSSGQFTLTYNGGLISPIGIITAGTMTQNYSTPSFSSPSSGQMNISFAGSTSLTGSGILFYIDFQITAVNSGGTSLSISNILFNQSLPGNSSIGNFNVTNLATLYISPPTGSLIAGDTLRFIASGGTPPYQWSISDSVLASIDNTGLLHTIKGGIVVVSAKDVFGGKGSSGNINLYDTKVSVLDSSSVSGDTIDLPVYLGALSNSFSILSLQGTIIFDSSLIKFNQIIPTGTMTNGWSYQINNQGNKVVIAGAGSGSFNNAGMIFKIRFIVSASAQVGYSSTVNLQQFMFNEGSPLPEIKNGSISIVSVQLPTAPSNLSASANGVSVINLSWSDNSNNESGFKIERSTDSLSGYSLVKTLTVNTVSYSDSGLVDGTKYFYRVYSYNNGGNSGYSNLASAITVLKAPSNLNGSGTTKIKLTWTNNSANESGFIIERKQGSGGIYSEIDTVSANIITFTDSNVVVGLNYVYRVKAFNTFVQSAYSNEFSITVTNVLDGVGNIPYKFNLYQNYPNPFNPSTVIKYDIPSSSFVTLRIYNIIGKAIATLVNEDKQPGEYSITFNADWLSSGIYFYTLDAGKFKQTKKFIILK